MDQIEHLPIDRVFPNASQPRKEFSEDELAELAASIASRGQLQPVRVTPRGDRFMLIMGERRWRALVSLGAETIAAIVQEATADLQVLIDAIVENRIRADVHPMEEAVAFQSALDAGMSVEELAAAIGLSQPWRVTDRTRFLNLRPEYQHLFRTGQLWFKQAQELAKLEPADQDLLFGAIKRGECRDIFALRSAVAGLKQAAEQTTFLPPDAPSEADLHKARCLEDRIRQAVAALRASTVDGEIVALRKIAPDRASTIADLIGRMQIDLARIQTALREHAQPALGLAS